MLLWSALCVFHSTCYLGGAATNSWSAKKKHTRALSTTKTCCKDGKYRFGSQIAVSEPKLIALQVTMTFKNMDSVYRSLWSRWPVNAIIAINVSEVQTAMSESEAVFVKIKNVFKKRICKTFFYKHSLKSALFFFNVSRITRWIRSIIKCIGLKRKSKHRILATSGGHEGKKPFLRSMLEHSSVTAVGGLIHGS